MAVVEARERLSAIPLRPARLRVGWVAVGVACLLGAGILGIFVGAVDISPVEVFRKLFGFLPFVGDSHLSAQHEAILMQLRLPRVVLAALVGGTLSISGAEGWRLSASRVYLTNAMHVSSCVCSPGPMSLNGKLGFSGLLLELL